MTEEQIKFIGQKKALVTTLVVIFVLLIYVIAAASDGKWSEARQVTRELFTFPFFMTMAALIVMTNIFGGMAAKEIIIYEKNSALVGLKYAAFMIPIMLIVPLLFAAIAGDQIPQGSIGAGFIALVIIFGIIWLWVAFRIRAAKTD